MSRWEPFGKVSQKTLMEFRESFLSFLRFVCHSDAKKDEWNLAPVFFIVPVQMVSITNWIENRDSIEIFG